MPVSHIGLTVSHLPSAVPFYTSSLQPLGYRIIRDEPRQVALGTGDEPELFICQDPSGGRPSGTHIAFAAETPDQVDAFFKAAVRAGARSFAAPGYKSRDTDDYGAAVIDLDNNAIEVMSGESVSRQGSRSGESQYAASSTAGGGFLERLPLRSIVNNITNNTSAPETAQSQKAPVASGGNSTLMGTLLGAAAGAAIAYAMTRSDSQGSSSPPPQPRSRSPPSGRSEHQSQRERRPSPPRQRQITMREETVYSRGAAPSQHSRLSRRSSEPRLHQLAIEAPPSRHSTIFDLPVRGLPAPPPVPSPPSMHRAPTTVVSVREPASVYSSASAATPKASVVASSHASRKSGSRAHTTDDYPPSSRHSYASRHSRRPSLGPQRSLTADALETYLPPSKASSRHTAAWEVDLPESRASSRYTAAPSHRGARDAYSEDEMAPSEHRRKHASEHSRHAPSEHSRHSHRSHRSRDPRDVALPTSAAPSHASTRHVPLPPSGATSYVSARDVALPHSVTASFLSRRPSPPRSSAAASSSTVRPLSRRNLQVAATETGVDDLDSIAPEDSISQASGKRRRRHRKSGSVDESSGSRADSGYGGGDGRRTTTSKAGTKKSTRDGASKTGSRIGSGIAGILGGGQSAPMTVLGIKS